MSISGTHNGDITISDSLEILGTVNGVVIVVEGGVLELKGTIRGQCRLMMGATARIRGSIIGELDNYGGQANIWGTVESLIDHGEETRSIIHENASIGNYKREH